jgi:signal transduction histidine kinase
MVEELLDFSKMQSGHFSLQFDTMDILAELGEAVLIYAERAKIEDITVTYEEPEMLPFVYGDKNRLKQVFINIIDNAIKYCDKNGSILVSAERRGKTIRLQVSNSYENGKNVDCSRFFDRFYRENTAHTQEEKGGFGIGLSIAESLVRQYKGTIDATWNNGVISFVCQLRG